MSSCISSNTTILLLVFPPDFFVYDFVFMPYVFGYDLVLLPYFLRIRRVFLRIRLLFLLIPLVILRIRPRITPVFLRILRVFLPYFFGYGVYFRRISSDTTILRLVFIPYILHGILRLVFLLIPAVILQYYLVYENPTARIFPRNVSTPSVFEFW